MSAGELSRPWCHCLSRSMKVMGACTGGTYTDVQVKSAVQVAMLLGSSFTAAAAAPTPAFEAAGAGGGTGIAA